MLPLFGAWAEFVDVVMTGIQLGDYLSDGDLDDAFKGVAFNAHQAVWDDLQENAGFNAGQQALAEIAEDAGMEYLDEVGIGDLDPDAYMDAIYGAAEGMEAISESINKAGAAIQHAQMEGAKGVAKFVGGLAE